MAIPARYVVSAALCMALSASASAKEFMPRLGITAEDHSNANRTAVTDDEISDTIFRPFFGFTFTEDTTDLKAKADVLLVYESYAQNTFSSQFLPTVDLTLDWSIQPNRLSWAVEDYAYSQRITVIAADTPDNRQNFNVFSTGPDFIFARGLYDGLAKFRIADVYYSESTEDNQRLIATGVLSRAINEYSSAGVEGSLSSIKFEEDYLIDYDMVSLVGIYNREMPFGLLKGRFGVDYVDHENGASDSTPEIALKVKSNEGALHSWALTYSTKYTDPAMDAYDPFYSRLLDVSETRVIQPGQIVGVGAYQTDRGEVSYGYNGSRFGVTLSAFSGKNSYLLNSLEDGDENGGGIGFSYLISDRLTFWADYYRSRTEYPNKPGDKFAKTTSPSFGISYQITESLSVVGGAYTSDNKSNITDPKTGDLTQQYKDNVLYMTVEYRGQSKRK